MELNDKEKKNQEYLNELLGGDKQTPSVPKPVKVEIEEKYDVSSSEYSFINVDILPSGIFYPQGTKVAIRASTVAEIQAYSMVDDENFVDVTEKMNELLSRNIKFIYPDKTKGSYRDIKDADRIFLIFMIRELTFQGGNTLTKEIECPHCGNNIVIPFRSTPGPSGPATFNLHEPNEEISEFYNKKEGVYELIYNERSWKLSPPTIGIQEDFYNEIKRIVQADKKPNVAFMKIVPFLMQNRTSISEEGLKAKLKEFVEMDDMVLFQGLNEIVNKMTVGIKGLKTKCSECGSEVYTELTFPGGASTLFEIPNILGRFRK